MNTVLMNIASGCSITILTCLNDYLNRLPFIQQTNANHANSILSSQHHTYDTCSNLYKNPTLHSPQPVFANKMSRNFSTPQFIPQSPLRRRYNNIQHQNNQQYDDHDDEVTYRPITPQRRGISQTRATSGPNTNSDANPNANTTVTRTPNINNFKSPLRTPRLNQQQHTPRTISLARPYDPNVTMANVSMVGTANNGNQSREESANYTTTSEPTFRDAYLAQVQKLEADWAQNPQ